MNGIGNHWSCNFTASDLEQMHWIWLDIARDAGIISQAQWDKDVDRRGIRAVVT